jgi:hypothetical protein
MPVNNLHVFASSHSHQACLLFLKSRTCKGKICEEFLNHCENNDYTGAERNVTFIKIIVTVHPTPILVCYGTDLNFSNQW